MIKDFLNKLLKPVLKRIVINRWDYNEQEYKKASELGLFDVFNIDTLMQWIKVEPICSNHCSGCHNEGKPFYFNALGLLIRHKCPPFICIHGLAQISPLIYIYYDYLLQGIEPSKMVFKHVTCTDIGLEHGGLGNNLFRVSVERMPLFEFLRFLTSMSWYIFFKNRKARGECLALKKQDKILSDYKFTESDTNLPLSDDELKEFAANSSRAKRLDTIEKFKEYQIVIDVVSSKGCIAGHKEGDSFFVDAAGILETANVENGICIMALHKVFWRVLLMLERMTYKEPDEKNFESKIFDLPMNCFGAGFPVGECGEILMKVKLRRRIK